MFLYDKLHVPQYLLREVAGSRAKRIYHVGCAELVDVPEVLVVEVVRSVETAARHERVGHAVGQSRYEGRSEVVVVQFLKEAVLRAVAYLAGVVVIILAGELRRNVVE
jgi:hypothetical protein